MSPPPFDYSCESCFDLMYTNKRRLNESMHCKLQLTSGKNVSLSEFVPFYFYQLVGEALDPGTDGQELHQLL